MDLNATQLLEAAREADGLVNLGQPISKAVRQAVDEARTRNDLGESRDTFAEREVVERLFIYYRNHI